MTGVNGIVVEVLNKENYSNWSTLVKNYLLGEGLWHGVVSGDRKEGEGKWDLKNSKALHAIQLSCGNDALNLIRRIETAEEAWNQLRASYSEDVAASCEEDRQSGTYDPQYDLHNLVMKGFWKDAQSKIEMNPDNIFEKSPDGKTVLHAAVSKGLNDHVKVLVNLGKERLVKMQDKEGYTALALAAQLTLDKNIAECMVAKGGVELLATATHKGEGEIPLLLAADKGHFDMTRYLFSVTPPSVLTNNFLDLLLSRCIANEIFDVAAAIVQHHNADQFSLSIKNGGKFAPIYELARKPSAFQSGAHLNWWEQFMYRILIVKEEKITVFEEETIEIISHVEVCHEDKPKTSTVPCLGRFFVRVQQFVSNSNLLQLFVSKKVYKMKRKHHLVREILKYFQKRVCTITLQHELSSVSVEDAMLQAAKCGIVEFIEAMMEANPALLMVEDQNERGIFSHAIMNRKEKVFQLIKKVKGPREIITLSADKFRNNMLHLAAELGPSPYLASISNAALQMQRELQWFREVQREVPHSYQEAKNVNDQVPSELFTKAHGGLLKEAQQWAKETSSSFTLVGTLIITIMFAAAFTVPGGNKGAEGETDDGTPVLFDENFFKIFIISDAISLVASSSSVLMFIGILTSRYAEEDFFLRLPLQLLFGLVLLFVSVVSMLLAFCAALDLMLKGHHRMILLTMMLALLPILVFVPSLLRLLGEIFRSTTRSIKQQFLQNY